MSTHETEANLTSVKLSVGLEYFIEVDYNMMIMSEGVRGVPSIKKRTIPSKELPFFVKESSYY